MHTKAVWEFKVYDDRGRFKRFEVQAPTRPFAIDKGKRIAKEKAPESVAFECKLLRLVNVT